MTEMTWEKYTVVQVTCIEFEGQLFDHYGIARRENNHKILRGFSGYDLYRDGTVFSDVLADGPFRQVKVGATVWISNRGGVSATKVPQEHEIEPYP